MKAKLDWFDMYWFDGKKTHVVSFKGFWFIHFGYSTYFSLS